jgi:hypothetical protein
MTHAIRNNLLALALAGAAATPAVAAEGGSGTVSLDGNRWEVADVMAWRDGDDIEVVFASQPFDRKEMAKDGRIDTFDFMGLDGPTLTVNIDADGPTMCYDYSTGSGGGSSCNSDYQSAVTLTRNADRRIAGKVDWTDDDSVIKLSFDLAITTEVERAGTPLPAGGGEPGKAVLAHFAAIATGDLAKIKAVSHPERVAMMDATDEAEAREMIGFLQAMTPTGVSVTGGVVDGDTAMVDYTGKRDGGDISGTAELVRVDGRWYVTGTNTRN